MLREFSKTSKTISAAVSLGEFVDQLLSKWSVCKKKVHTAWFFEETKSKSLLDTLQSNDITNKHSQVLLVFSKIPRKWNYVKFRAEDLHRTYCRYFEWICCFNEVFLMALTFTEQLFIERLLYRRFLHNDHLPISSNLCKKFLCRCFVKKGVLRKFAKFTAKHLWRSLIFNKVAGWGDWFWSFSCLLLKDFLLFCFNRKMKWKKGNTPMKFKY